ncbi:MAG: hypothetical protein P8Q53_04465 [Flavobacteriaceae bacterium]|nr:hypothetical protein [Flavobacteriaceae bacterium]
MLSKDKCKNATTKWKDTIKKWQKEKATVKEINKIIDPTAVFNFSQADCNWIHHNNKFSNFHAYAGIYDHKFILIIVPLDENGEENTKLKEYKTVNLTDLKDDITLTQIDIVTTKTETTLSKDLEVIERSKNVNLPTCNHPTIKEKDSIREIIKWKNECLEWFSFMCSSKHKRKKIFTSFSVPIADLPSNDNNAVALFGFEDSSIYKMLIPVLVFVSITSKEKPIHKTKEKSIQSTIETNTKNWSHPSPPYANKSFSIFN